MLNDFNFKDGAIIVRSSETAYIAGDSPKSRCSLEEHIRFINDNHLDTAIIIAESLEFITRCPTLKYIRIDPADTAKDGFDYSPLYDMPEIRSLSCRTLYGEKDKYSTVIDYSQIKGLKSLGVSGPGPSSYQKLENLESLHFSCNKNMEDLSNFDCPKVKEMRLLQCGIKSLNGIEKFKSLQKLDLWYDRKLEDISEISALKDALRWISIECCPKITDFSSFYDLIKIEALSLEGKNDLPSLDFVKNMPNLTWLILTMNVLDGDMTPCLKLPYVDIKAKKHYNLKNRDLPKNSPKGGFEIK